MVYQPNRLATFNQDGTPAMSTTTLDLARQWGIDARNAGLDRDTLTTDREAVRAIRDAAHDEGHADAYTVDDGAIKGAWLEGYDFAPALAYAAEEALDNSDEESLTPAQVADYMRAWAPEYAEYATEIEATEPALAQSIRAVLDGGDFPPLDLTHLPIMARQTAYYARLDAVVARLSTMWESDPIGSNYQTGGNIANAFWQIENSLIGVILGSTIAECEISVSRLAETAYLDASEIMARVTVDGQNRA